jgi:putative transposase
MRIRNGATGKSYFRKLRKRIDEPGQARELTFSCYKRFKFLDSDRTRHWFIEELTEARMIFPVDLWAYVIMPEHVHLLIFPREANAKAGVIAGKIKEQVARKAIQYLKENAPEWLTRIAVQEGNRMRYRFWQPGGGYDRNAVEISTVHKMIEYIHMNPVRRGLVARPEDWPWSSARWYAGMKSVPIEIDRTIPMIHDAGARIH